MTYKHPCFSPDMVSSSKPSWANQSVWIILRDGGAIVVVSNNSLNTTQITYKSKLILAYQFSHNVFL